MSAFSKRDVILRYVYMYVSVCTGISIYRAGGNGEATPLLAGPVLFLSQGESGIPFLQKARNGQSASVILGLAGLIILSYNRWKKHIKRCKIIICPLIMLTGYSIVQKAK